MIRKKIIKNIFLLGVFILPFFFWPFSSVSYEVPRVTLYMRWIEVLALMAIFSRLSRKKIDISLITFSLLFLLWAFISSFFGTNFDKSFWGNYYRADGLWTLVHSVSLVFILSLFWEKSWQEKFKFLISAGSFTLSLLVVVQAFRFFVLKDASIANWGGGIGLTFGNPNFLAGYLLVTFPFVVQGKKAFIKGTLQLTAILFTRSFLAPLIAIFYLLCLGLSKAKKGSKKRIFMILNLLLILLSFLIITPKVKRFFYPKTPGEAIDNRLRIARSGLLAFAKSPLTGYGWANFDYAFDNFTWPKKYNDDIYVDKAHSTFLEILVTTGVVGLVIYLALVFKVGKKLLFLDKTFFAAFILFIIHSQTNVISISEEAIFWIMTGISSSFLKKT